MKDLDENVRLKVSQAYCNLRSRRKSHSEAVDIIEKELFVAAKGKVSFIQLLKYQQAIAPYCMALKKKVEGGWTK